jgi:hypothetical protein
MAERESLNNDASMLMVVGLDEARDDDENNNEDKISFYMLLFFHVGAFVKRQKTGAGRVAVSTFACKLVDSPSL